MHVKQAKTFWRRAPRGFVQFSMLYKYGQLHVRIRLLSSSAKRASEETGRIPKETYVGHGFAGISLHLHLLAQKLGGRL